MMDQEIERFVGRIKSLHEGDLAVAEAVAIGPSAIPPLRELLFQREPSGLFQVRCRAVEALCGLKAFDVLFEYLSAEHAAADPVERLGDDAVINCAALALAKARDERAFSLLLSLARRPCLTGVIAALAAYNRPEAIPLLVDALEEDASRTTAESALKRLGAVTCPALQIAAELPFPSADQESESSRRRRRSARKVLDEIEASHDVVLRARPKASAG